MSNYQLDDSLGFLVAMAGRALMNQLQRNITESGYDVTTEHWTILVQLWEQEGLSQYELAQRTGKDQPSMSRLIQNMLKRELIVRVADTKDARCKRIYLTEHGKQLRSQLVSIVEETLDQATKDVSEEELLVTKSVLKRVAKTHSVTRTVFDQLDRKKELHE
ncbi:MarR family transcriptional regulator [Alkalihalophilus lindianensis]|uniref:MarR family transcriptional regulator n=1 Tax=Alkalihalophilus lindianensis TaxID=1630542 RepID=A0ABU3X776_9BACI|nr:MarR family transcriptional regulator [Alkalihalophilus lindianensis]MDV2683752.1 MarR family transcriptional regulator [Alkalihalophilus lindianensis]